MSIAEFVQRTTTSGIDNGKPEGGKVVLETEDGPNR